MKTEKSSNPKTSQQSKAAPAAGVDGVAIAPPAYEAGAQPVSAPAIQRKADPSSAGGDSESGASPNRTGLPDALKSGIESLSGLAMDDVRVHYNSPQPAQLQALAYAQGTDIHLGPGQERHLPHEAWHVVQQKQGRVKPTLQAKGFNINDTTTLEHEADEKGKAAVSAFCPQIESLSTETNPSTVVQRKVGFEFQTNIGCDIADKGVPIFQGADWKMEGDQGELEFITEAFNEEGPRPELKRMRKAVWEIATIAHNIESMGKKLGYGKGSIPLTTFNKYGKVIPYKGKPVTLGVGAWAMAGVSASPQVTGGVSLGNIGYFMNQVLSTTLPVNQTLTEGSPSPEDWGTRDIQTATAGGSNYARYQTLFARARDLAFDEEMESRLEIEELESTTDFSDLGIAPISVTDEEWNRVEGFLTYVFLYLLTGDSQQNTTDQTKYLFALMSRTSFSAMFRALPQEYRILRYFPEEILERAGLGDGYLFRVGLKSGSDPLYRGPTRVAWLTSIEEGQDLLSSALSNNKMVEDSGFGSPALGKYPELETDVQDGVLIEIRSLPREVTPPYWIPMATTLFNMFRDVQTPG